MEDALIEVLAMHRLGGVYIHGERIMDKTAILELQQVKAWRPFQLSLLCQQRGPKIRPLLANGPTPLMRTALVLTLGAAEVLSA